MFGIRTFCRNCFVLSRQLHVNNRYTNLVATTKYSTKTTKNDDPDVMTDAPIKYSTSNAKNYRAEVTRTGIQHPRLWYEPYVILASISIFMLYFTVFREENDIDEELGRTLYSRIEGLEEYQLKLSLQYNKEHGKDITDIVNRLKEIEEEKLRLREQQQQE